MQRSKLEATCHVHDIRTGTCTVYGMHTTTVEARSCAVPLWMHIGPELLADGNGTRAPGASCASEPLCSAPGTVEAVGG